LAQVKKITALYNKGKNPDWGDWRVKSCIETLEYYRKRGWVKNKIDYNISFNQLQTAMLSHFVNKEFIVKKMITSNLEFKMFLYLHTIFPIFYDTNDWLISIVRDNIEITDKEMDKYLISKKIPNDIIKKLSIFNPEPVYFDFYPVKIMFGFWQRDEDDKICDPVRIIDTSLLGRKLSGSVNSYYSAQSFISQYKIIDLNNWVPDNTIVTWDMYKKKQQNKTTKNDEKVPF